LSAPAIDRTAVLAVLALTANAFTWGVLWLPFRWFAAQGLHPLWATVAVYGAVVLMISAWRPRAWGQLLRAPALWWLVLAAGTTNAAYNTAATLGDVVRAVLLFYLMPLWAVLLARVLLGERLTLLAALRVALALAGALVVLWPADGSGLPLPRSTADALAVLGGFGFALNNVILRREARHSQSARALAMFLGALLVPGAAALVLGALGLVAPPPPPAPAWIGGAVALGAVFLVGNFALQYGAARLPANATSVVMVSEVVFAAGSAAALGAGVLTLQMCAGGALILAAALLAAWRR
jgi:drug/metabolite transporter (DMT)-like permease